MILMYYMYDTQTIRNIVRSSSCTHNVPKVLIRTYYSKKVKRLFYEYCHRPWVKFNPRYSIIWFDNKECTSYMKKLGPRYINAYKKIKPGAYKADLWRACVLYEQGGIYTDSYTVPYCSLYLMMLGCWNPGYHQFISIKERVVDPETNVHGVHNGFIACTPKHPFMKQYISDMLDNIENEYYGPTPLSTTGPCCLKNSMSRALKQELTVDFELGHNEYGDLSFYLFDHGKDAYQTVYKNDMPIMQKKHSILRYIYDHVIRSGYLKNWRGRTVFRPDKKRI